MNIVINATASRTSGALSILRDFIEYIKDYNHNDKVFFVFISIDVDTIGKVNNDKIIYVRVKKKNWIERIIWDEGGLKRYCKKSNIHPDLIVSLQNTSTLFKNVKQLVYYHQPLPLIKYKWNLFNLFEFKLFLYTKFYAYFVKRNSINSYYSVQLPYIRDLFIKKFRNISEDRIRVIRPNLPIIDNNAIEKINLDKRKFIYFYPATLLSYKNHEVLIDALCILKEKNPKLLNKIQLLLTLDKLTYRLEKRIKKYSLESNFNFLGSLKYFDVLRYYKSVDALLFPSKIETFGLPLLEASSFGLPVIASELPFAKEVLCQYDNSYFVDPNSADDWANAIANIDSYCIISKKMKNNKNNSWDNFMNFANLIIEGDLNNV